MSIELQDLSFCCKACLSPNEKEFIYLDTIYGDGQTVWEQILSVCPSVLIRDDFENQPKILCLECHSQLETAFNFQQQILLADSQLREVLTNVEEEIKTEVEVGEEEEEDTEDAEEENEQHLEVDDSGSFLVQVEEDFNSPEDENEDELLQRLCTTFQKPKESTVPDGTTVVYVNNCKNFQCVKCNLVVGRRDKAIPHVKNCIRVIEIAVDDINVEVEEFKVRPTRRSKSPVSLTCQVCQKTFANRVTLKNHERRHTGDLPFKCPCCGQAFPYKLILERHMRSHTGERKFNCDTCGKGFATKAGMESHKRLHSGDLPFSCDVCYKKFNSNSNLKIHYRTHTGEKPYQCTECSKYFAGSNDLAKHLRKHLGELLYDCKICQQRFRTQMEVRRHMIVHAVTEEIVEEVSIETE